jgi:hypothetical protein
MERRLIARKWTSFRTYNELATRASTPKTRSNAGVLVNRDSLVRCAWPRRSTTREPRNDEARYEDRSLPECGRIPKGQSPTSGGEARRTRWRSSIPSRSLRQRSALVSGSLRTFRLVGEVRRGAGSVEIILLHELGSAASMPCGDHQPYRDLVGCARFRSSP